MYSLKMLKNRYLIIKIGVDTAENEIQKHSAPSSFEEPFPLPSVMKILRTDLQLYEDTAD